MRIALLTGPSGAGKTFVAYQLRTQFDCFSYDDLMRDSIDEAFPGHAVDKWDKQIWLDNSSHLDPVAALRRAFDWLGQRPLLVEGWQLRESVWRDAILALARSRAQTPTVASLFMIRPTLDLLVRQRAESKREYHRRHATVADCQKQIEIHEKLYHEQPWQGALVQRATKEESLEAVRAFLSVP